MNHLFLLTIQELPLLRKLNMTDRSYIVETAVPMYFKRAVDSFHTYFNNLKEETK